MNAAIEVELETVHTGAVGAPAGFVGETRLRDMPYSVRRCNRTVPSIACSAGLR